MKPPFPIIALLLIVQALVCGCASLPPAGAPGCHGPRRPANPNGSVLASPAMPAVAVAPAEGSAPPCGGAQP
jgi:hypothetical protein